MRAISKRFNKLVQIILNVRCRLKLFGSERDRFIYYREKMRRESKDDLIINALDDTAGDLPRFLAVRLMPNIQSLTVVFSEDRAFFEELPTLLQHEEWQRNITELKLIGSINPHSNLLEFNDYERSSLFRAINQLDALECLHLNVRNLFCHYSSVSSICDNLANVLPRLKVFELNGDTTVMPFVSHQHMHFTEILEHLGENCSQIRLANLHLDTN